MFLTRASYEIKQHMSGEDALKLLEWAGRKCYKSEDKIEDGSAGKFIRNLLNQKPAPHESVIEHASISVCFITDRGVSHEIVRHRLAAYSQESTRYCNYNKKGMTFIIPPWVNIPEGVYNTWEDIESFEGADIRWISHLIDCELVYNDLLKDGWKPEQARSVLPNSLKTEIVSTYNMRQWRHVFKLRTFERAHPQMRELMVPLLAEFKKIQPVIFDDL